MSGFNLIILKILPLQPVVASDFTSTLEDLTITAYDLTVEDSVNGVQIGSATSKPNPPPAPHKLLRTIFQDFTESAGTRTLQSVGTAVFITEAPPGHIEYLSPTSYDIRFVINRGGIEMTGQYLEYNIPLTHVTEMHAAEETYIGLTPSAYLQLPPQAQPPQSDVGYVQLNSNGQAPDFDSLRQAVNRVLDKDHPTGDSTGLSELEVRTTPLTAAQSTQIAREITWNRSLNPTPNVSSADLATMYTLLSNSSSTPNTELQQFQSQLSSYHNSLDATATQLTQYVFAASAAIFCERQTLAAKAAGLTFPVITDASGPTSYTESSVVLTGSPDPSNPGQSLPLDPSFVVPAGFFYYLGASFSTQILYSQRYSSAINLTEDQLLSTFNAGIDSKALPPTVSPITGGSAINVNQAARRLIALGSTASSSPQIEMHSIISLISPPVSGSVGWLIYQDTTANINSQFWTSAIQAHPRTYVRLLLEAITRGDPRLVKAIENNLSITNVSELVAVTNVQWQDFFAANPNLLPSFTAPGSVSQQVTIFLQNLRKFFTVPSVSTPVPTILASPLAVNIPPGDVLQQFIKQYQTLQPGTFNFSNSLDSTSVKQVLQELFPNDPEARDWLRHALDAIHTLVQVTSIGQPDLQFSLIEALYACGFTTTDRINSLTQSQFQKALAGTIAYPFAGDIYSLSTSLSQPPQTWPLPGPPFSAINPNGSLTDCIPPPNLSPLGLIQYVHELLAISFEGSTLANYIAQRRGPLGNLLTTLTNLEISLPTIDLVNESLEFLGSNILSDSGAIYNTNGQTLGGFQLGNEPPAHNPGTMFLAIPEYSSPATPVAQPAIYDTLNACFTSPKLPYAQPLDICRSYLSSMNTTRFNCMRHFRENITELAIDAALEPSDFQRHLWRFPIRLEIALEYLHLSYEEYSQLFSGSSSDIAVLTLLGYNVSSPNPAILTVPGFMKFTGLDFCEFIALWKCKYVLFSRDVEDGKFPDCPLCCLEKLHIWFPVTGADLDFALHKLFVFIRLWRKLQQMNGKKLTFNQLADICNVLGLFVNDSINADFVRQLASLLLLNVQFNVPLSKPSNSPTATADQRTQLLALWVGPASTEWNWALKALLDRIGPYAKARFKCRLREKEFTKKIEASLSQLAILAGFMDNDSWHAKPTNTLRFAEVLSKIYASEYTIGEIVFLFTVAPRFPNDDPYPLLTQAESITHPLNLPRDSEFELWELRRKLLKVEITEEDIQSWTFQKIESTLVDLGMPSTSLADLAKHFFPFVLASHSLGDNRFEVSLPATATTEFMWNLPEHGPFRYDPVKQTLSTKLPIRPHEIIYKLRNIRQLNGTEALAVQELYFAPRDIIAPFACMFEDFPYALERLVLESDQEERFWFFKRQFALFYRRCRVIAEHLADHVSSVTDWKHSEAADVAWHILRTLLADENRPTTEPWENDSGEPPKSYLWEPRFSGSALASLVGLIGTGLLEEFKDTSGSTIWRDECVNLTFFWGEEEDHVLLHTTVPSAVLATSPGDQELAILPNEFAMYDVNGEPLRNVNPFGFFWKGTLLIENTGEYRFFVGAPRPNDGEPDFEQARHHQWQVVLRRDQTTWTILNHLWVPGDPLVPQAMSLPLELHRGAYHIEIHFEQGHTTGRDYLFHTGFQVKYIGPDTDGYLMTVPLRKLFREFKHNTLREGLNLSPSAAAFLDHHYTSDIRDIRRTYQRAFKGILFVHRFGLSPKDLDHDHHHAKSELGYILHHESSFLGTSYYRLTVSGATTIHSHHAYFDFNFLPVSDPYHPPTPIEDSRVDPSMRRQAALFDWWERIFDYTYLRHWLEEASKGPVWKMFYDAALSQSPPPDQLVQHLLVDTRLASLILTYFNPTGNFQITSSDFTDERWAIRAWHASIWLRDLEKHFHTEALQSQAIPSLWASDYQNLVAAGNQNLTHFVQESYFGNRHSRSYKKIKQVNDGLREHARDALLTYLCQMNRVPLPFEPNLYTQAPRELSDLLLQDVEVGLCEKSTRIEDAIGVVHRFVQRARLGLEPIFIPTRKFLCAWDAKYATFKIWEGFKRRQLYRENWILWDDLQEARDSEAFRILENNICQSVLTIPKPGGLVWWSDRELSSKSLNYLQSANFASLELASQDKSMDEGFHLIAEPESDGQLSWIAQLPDVASSAGSSTPQPGSDSEPLPQWITAAVRMGTQFLRIAAATKPAAIRPYSVPDKEVRCCECGKIHPPVVDEFYFWLANTNYFKGTDVAPQDATPLNPPDPTCNWDTPTNLPTLLHWTPEPMLHLFWCRVHFGKFNTPRRSDFGVPIPKGGTPPQLIFQQRKADFLFFGFNPSPSTSSGFCYDMTQDAAITLPQVGPPPTIDTSNFPQPLLAYPYFIFYRLGAPLIPPSRVSTAVAIARILQSQCCFEDALRWYKLAFDPLKCNNAWAQCPPKLPVYPQPTYGGTDVPCCPSELCTPGVARGRAILLEYLEVLLQWVDAFVCQKSRDSCQKASVILNLAEKLLGPSPRRIRAHENGSASMTITTFKPLAPPLNPRLLVLYDRLAEWQSLIHHCSNLPCQCNGPKCGDLLKLGPECLWEYCQPSNVSCHRRHPYRFSAVLPKALDLVSTVRSLGASLLSAFEKGDAEYLEALRATHDRQLLVLALDSKKNQFRESDWQVQALEQTLSGALCRLTYYQNLIKNGLNSGEIGYEDSTEASLASRAAANVTDGIGQGMAVTPDEWMGVAGIYGTPLDFMQLPVGSKLAGSFSIAARILNTLADISNTTAGLELTQSGWDRRLEDWNHQVDVITIELLQIERQKLAADRQKAISLRELNSQQRQIEHSIEVQDFIRDKFTKQDLYLFLQHETMAIYRQFYDLALQAAREAEQLFWYERRDNLRNFLPESAWDNLRDGLLAGEKLELALRTMERVYMEVNCREYELSKILSLCLHFPAAFLLLKTTGFCEIEIPEWMFDFDYPGQYMRRIKNVSLTIPCVTGPYVGIHCRLQLLSSSIRVEPYLTEPTLRCCSDCSEDGDGYEPVADDPRFVHQYGVTEGIATSNGQTDTGLFQLSFNDERYLPFEFAGAVSRWRIELPPENNQFDLNTLSDVVIQLNYTAREGGEELRRAANKVAQRYLPGSGWRLFDVRHEFPDAVGLFKRIDREMIIHEHLGGRNLPLRLSRRMFPFLPGHREVYVIRVDLFIKSHCAVPGEYIKVEYCHGADELNEIACIATCEWPRLYHGTIQVNLGPLSGPHEFGHLRFPEHCDIENLYLLTRYEVHEMDPCRPEVHIQEHGKV